MRIPTQNTTPQNAGRAQELPSSEARHGVSRGSYDDLVALFAPGADDATGPEGIAAQAHREVTDPLGLAARQDAVTAGPATAQPPPADAAPHGVERDTDAKQPNTPRQNGPGTDALRQAEPASRSAATAPETARSKEQSPAPGAERVQAGGSSAGAGSSEQLGPAAPAAVATAGVSSRGVQAGQVASQAVTGVRAVGSSAGVGTPNAGATIGQATQGGESTRLSADAKGAGSAAPRGSLLRGESAELAPQVAKGLASLVLKDGGRAQIQLRPEALGRVEVDLSIRDGVVNARLSAENETARELLGSELDRLRSLLEQRGLRVERLEIVPGEREQEARGETGESRGGRWTPAQDDPRGSGTDAETGSPGSGGDGRWARGGAPWSPAERGRPKEQAGTAEAGASHEQDGIGAPDRRSSAGVLVRLDTVA